MEDVKSQFLDNNDENEIDKDLVYKFNKNTELTDYSYKSLLSSLILVGVISVCFTVYILTYDPTENDKDTTHNTTDTYENEDIVDMDEENIAEVENEDIADIDEDNTPFINEI